MRGRNVLVTGAGGFIGGHLVDRLVADGAEVRAFCRYNSRDDRGALEWLEQEVQRAVDVRMGDLRDFESVSRSMAGCEIVMHLGAQIAIPYSYRNPRDFFETNALGALNVAEAALAHGVDRLVHTSTSEVYGTAQSVPITESHPLEAQSPYAASKIASDKLMESYHRTYGLPVIVLRPFNTYGPRQSGRAVLPTIVTQALEGLTLKLGALDPRRDLTYVADTVSGFIAAASTPEAVGRTLQLGTGDSKSVRQLVDLVGEILGRQLTVLPEPARLRPPASEVDVLVSDPSLVRSLCGWEPQVTLREGVELTIEWIRANRNRFRIGEYVI